MEEIYKTLREQIKGNRGRTRTRRQSNPITQLPIYKYISRGLQILNHI